MNEISPIPATTAKDWASDQEVRWCPGCGDYAVLKAVQRKAKGHKIVYTPRPDAEEEATNVTDLMSALQKSLQRAGHKKEKVTA